MTTQRDLERALDTFFELGADEVADRVIDDALLTIEHTPQRRALRVPWRFLDMPSSLKFATAAVVAIVAIGGAIWMIGRGPGPGVGGQAPASALPSASPAPTASPSPSPSASPSNALLDPSTWVTYRSERYGFQIAHPADWTETPATHDWTLPADVDWLSTGAELFFTTVDEGVRMTAWSVETEPGTTVDAWLQVYCPLTMVNTDDPPDQCPTLIANAAAATMDGHSGLLMALPTDTRGFFLVEDRLYVVGVWRPETDPSVAKYSGTRRLVETAISTMRLLPGGPAPASSAPPN